jgi:hypothetical protein
MLEKDSACFAFTKYSCPALDAVNPKSEPLPTKQFRLRIMPGRSLGIEVELMPGVVLSVHNETTVRDVIWNVFEMEMQNGQFWLRCGTASLPLDGKISDFRFERLLFTFPNTSCIFGVGDDCLSIIEVREVSASGVVASEQ